MNFNDLVPSFILNSNTMKELYKAQYKQLEKLNYDLLDLKNQLFIDTATWGLEYWEKEYQLPINPSLSYEERRSRIKSRILRPKRVGADTIEDLVYRLLGLKSKVSFNNRIIINILGDSYIDLTNQVWRKEIDRIKPAHLGIDFQKINQENIILSEDNSILKVKYPLSNKSKTKSKKVNSTKNNISINENYKLIPVKYSITGKSKTKSVESGVSHENIAIKELYKSIKVKYPVTNKSICGGGRL